MKLIWNGHSCFSVQTQGKTVVFDPYVDDCVPGLAPLRLTADAVYCSHGHRDHNATELVTLSGQPCDVPVQSIPEYHDRVFGLRRGKNTIHILQAEGLRLAHLGDLGRIPPRAVLSQLEGVDALLIPIGGFFTIDAATAYKLVQKIRPRLVVPMHYRLGDMGYKEIGELHQFTDLCSNVVFYDTNTLELTGHTQPQTAILTYCHG